MKDLHEVYDDELSSSVSLSKILDMMIVDNTKLSIIIEFLKQHDEFFKDIIVNSMYWMRLFQLDCILKYNVSDIDYVLSKLKSIPGRYAAYCCWQILNSFSGCANDLKYRFRKEMSWILDTFKITHPYKSHIAKIESSYDRRISNLFQQKHEIEDVANEFNHLKPEAFREFIVNLKSSIFKYRILQCDFFSNLNDEKKYLFINALSQNDYIKNECYNFIMQILDSDEDVEVKSMFIDNVMLSWDYESDDKYYNCMHANSFGEMMLNMTIEGDINPRTLIMRLIDERKYKRLKEWKDFNEKEFNDIMNIGELVEYKIKTRRFEKDEIS